jgi:hypothetical protein
MQFSACEYTEGCHCGVYVSVSSSLIQIESMFVNCCPYYGVVTIVVCKLDDDGVHCRACSSLDSSLGENIEMFRNTENKDIW